MAKKKSPFAWVKDMFGLVTELVDIVKEESEEKIEEIKEKVKYYTIVYGLFVVALFFILIGLIKYLAEINVFYTEGIGFLVTGAVMIVILAAYSLIKRV